MFLITSNSGALMVNKKEFCFRIRIIEIFSVKQKNGKVYVAQGMINYLIVMMMKLELYLDRTNGFLRSSTKTTPLIPTFSVQKLIVKNNYF